MEFEEALKKGHAKGISQISNSLYESAINGSNVAQIFYLKNRDPENWADTQSMKTQINITKKSDSQLLDGKRLDPIISSSLKNIIPHLE